MSGIEHLHLRYIVKDPIHRYTKLRVLREGRKAIIPHDLLHNLFVPRIENSSCRKGCYLFQQLNISTGKKTKQPYRGGLQNLKRCLSTSHFCNRVRKTAGGKSV
jgi:hypothetical protein